MREDRQILVTTPAKLGQSLALAGLLALTQGSFVYAEAVSFRISTAGAVVDFKTECTKKSIYFGEPALCNYVLYSTEDVVEVEVAKFPEYRGFWSENLALRQGPIPLNGSPESSNGMKRAVIGTYLVIPMVGKTDPQLEPMKLALRRSFGFQHPSLPESELVSDSPGLEIKPLPPVPERYQTRFHGAVGTFTLQLDSPQAVFQKDEPVSVRFTLSGEGNFPEINEVELSSLPQLETLSRKSYAEGSGQFQTKTFEVTLAVHAEQSFPFPGAHLVYFDPSRGTYNEASTPPIPFTFIATPPEAKPSDTSDALEGIDDSLEPSWSTYRPIQKRLGFLLLNGLGLLLALGLGLTKRLRAGKLRPTHSEEFERKRQWAEALEALDAGQTEAFLRKADALVFAILSERAGLPPGSTRLNALRKLRTSGDSSLAENAAEIFSALELMVYSPAKSSPPDLMRLKTALSQVVSAPLRPRAA